MKVYDYEEIEFKMVRPSRRVFTTRTAHILAMAFLLGGGAMLDMHRKVPTEPAQTTGDLERLRAAEAKRLRKANKLLKR